LSRERRGGQTMETAMSTSGQPQNVAVWFEIPAANFDRAAGFYERIFDAKFKREQFGKQQIAVFPYERPGVSGCVMEAPNLAGKDAGTVVYLNCNGRLDEIVGRVEAAGGKLLTPRIDLPGDMGAFFHIRDSEGNRVGLHAVP
jgi:predicted enzyme related to lactoylglutathione lyase